MERGIEWREPTGGGDPLVEGLWHRLRDVLMVAERVDTYAFGPDDPGAPRERLTEDDAGTLARDLVLRALRAAGDALNWAILRRAARSGEGVPLDDLAAETGVPRVVVAERISDLVQVGLAARALDADRAHATPAGKALAAWIEGAGADLARRVREHGRE